MISFLVAMDEGRVIGKNNGMPWHLPADLAYFKQTTMGAPIIMGRHTHESIGRALPGRENIVVTRQKQYQADGCRVVHSTEAAVDQIAPEQEAFVIGGSYLFRELIHRADRLYITLIHEHFAGDTYFPEIDVNQWQLLSSQQGKKDDKNPYDYEFLIYERKMMTH